MLDWLRSVRMVRRGAEPELAVLGELFRSGAGKFQCPDCGALGLAIRPAAEEDDEAWGMARRCDACGKPIARERLDALPDTRLCAACQAGDERGESCGPAEYCPKCGAVMTLRQSRGAGLSRYEMMCPNCRR
jgi:predicted RNA-binding Zn-ribbon protein involved in translation (DUF1610 family)